MLSSKQKILIAIICVFAISNIILISSQSMNVVAAGGKVKAPRKAKAMASRTRGYSLQSTAAPETGSVSSIFDVYNCDYWNDKRCRDKLSELNLEYCHCYQDSTRNILACGYRYDVCKPPKFF